MISHCMLMRMWLLLILKHKIQTHPFRINMFVVQYGQQWELSNVLNLYWSSIHLKVNDPSQKSVILKWPQRSFLNCLSVSTQTVHIWMITEVNLEHPVGLIMTTEDTLELLAYSLCFSFGWSAVVVINSACSTLVVPNYTLVGFSPICSVVGVISNTLMVFSPPCCGGHLLHRGFFSPVNSVVVVSWSAFESHQGALHDRFFAIPWKTTSPIILCPVLASLILYSCYSSASLALSIKAWITLLLIVRFWLVLHCISEL